jgi:hypothetical protein
LFIPISENLKKFSAFVEQIFFVDSPAQHGSYFWNGTDFYGYSGGAIVPKSLVSPEKALGVDYENGLFQMNLDCTNVEYLGLPRIPSIIAVDGVNRKIFVSLINSQNNSLISMELSKKNCLCIRYL